jgi:hypothetical protein
MQFYHHRTVREQANRLPYELREAYRKSQIDRITIFDGVNEIEVTGYSDYSYFDEKSYKTQPIRTEDGSIQEIEEYATFLTPRLIISYNMMSIEDYRSLMRMIKNRNGFIVKCYDLIEDRIVRNEMYVAPTSMPKIYQQHLIVLGIQEQTIEFIGTNVSIQDGETEKINFEVGMGIKFNAHIGYTWRDFLSSKYNNNFSIYDNNHIMYGTTEIITTGNHNPVEADQYIIKNGTYLLKDISDGVHNG